jgi:glycosyltransferase involved in cell wall biosynthesis
MKTLKKILYLLTIPLFLLLALGASAIGRMRRGEPSRVIFGSSPLISNVHWQSALKAEGYDAITWMTNTPSILGSSPFDVDFSRRFGAFAPIAMSIYFLRVLVQPALIFTTCDGFLLGQSPMWRAESFLLTLSGSKTVVIPYGGDSYVYSRVYSPLLAQALQLSYPDASKTQKKIQRRVEYWVRNANIFIPGVMYLDGFGRADVLTPSPFCIDVSNWNRESAITPQSPTRTIIVTHAPNHRGFKGTEFIIQAVHELQIQGYEIELKLLEGLPNSEVREALMNLSDIHVEQLIADGYAFNAIEAMAAGVPVVSNLSGQSFTRPLRLWSFLEECPIVSASPESIKEVLEELLLKRSDLPALGQAMRKYVEKRHSYASFLELFLAIEHKLKYPDFKLIDIYRPEIKDVKL